MSLGSSKELAENKIILLYMIDKVNMPVSNHHITKLVLENKFMNYFILQQFLNELCDSGFLELSENGGKSFYSITPNGKKTLEYFVNLIPFGIKSIIDNTIPEIRSDIKKESLISADYTPKSENEYIVSCKLKEDNFTLIDLCITVGTKSDARTICENWKNNPQQIYSEIIASLTRKRDKTNRDKDKDED
ncbi:hypothetical protein CDQ84_08550 [Clostridium thermosuccinogenes]|uniref:DUF4364 domain-containing protein n=2 Tax=Clostridium thermosuccinogenes TaxID=84032 RepID=A0A2K2FFE9_9CLOT|nr:DUF4364 family protein [Pseudoclostridium thermosuccinogenes]AUS98843.1 hypothetical protein CDO33_14845 [Pseudoclostridium thermosuccinogenes]PNT94479.1 hypothetical protein CDQ83_10345 [Pseudoclostridium thermosuccinogenes]PNT97499.1 hypothetical protein CDQ85_08395 [Pseudoclostridium thermosuccinogenes]PNT99530.1 hypothetical protein CDQ84_08550 [Pseudoclostridium thermosuccinogenes]